MELPMIGWAAAGAAGMPGVDGMPGADGMPGVAGAVGTDGVDGTVGPAGVDGTGGVDIVGFDIDGMDTLLQPASTSAPAASAVPRASRRSIIAFSPAAS
jgi:hypothetical protein